MTGCRAAVFDVDQIAGQTGRGERTRMPTASRPVAQPPVDADQAATGVAALSKELELPY